MRANITACLAVILFSFSLATPVDKCASGAMPISVQINDCTKQPCPLRHGTNTTLLIQFQVSKDVENIITQAVAFSLGAKVNYQLPDDNACHTLTDGECPLDAGEVVTYRLDMPISSAFPSVPVVIDFSLLGDGKDVICCFSVSCQVM